MGKKSSKAPKAPDPREVASAQAQSNIATAMATRQLGMVNQYTPDGSLTYSTQGETDWVDPISGKIYKIPNVSATTKLSDAQQAIKDQSDKAELNLASLAAGQSGRLQGLLDRPLDLDTEAIEDNILKRYGPRMERQMEMNRRRAETDAANRGLRLGGDAYDRLMRGVSEQENDAYNQLYIGARGQALNELLTERNQPLNEISALLSGAAVSQPNFVSTPQAGVANVDYAGLVNNKYQADLAQWQQQRQDRQAMLGGLFDIAKTAVAYSDRRLKTDIEKVGETPDDIGLYTWRYKGGGPMHLGLIAQDVEKKMPQAVSKDARGFRRVDYRKALHLTA